MEKEKSVSPTEDLIKVIFYNTPSANYDINTDDNICVENDIICAENNLNTDHNICVENDTPSANYDINTDHNICVENTDHNICVENDTPSANYDINTDSVENDININDVTCDDSDDDVVFSSTELNAISSSSDSENDENLASAGNVAVSGNIPRKSIKELRNRGKSYTSRSGKIVGERVVRKLSPCRKRCAEKISYEQQTELHKKYWAHGSYCLRQAAAAALIEVVETKTAKKFKSAVNPRKREHNNNYFLEIDNERISVCQKCFRYTLSETEQSIKSVVKSKLNGFIDMRGKHKNPRKLTPVKENEICNFIKRFPSYESHYTRRDTSKRYLSSDLSVSELHRLYCVEYDHSVSLSTFSRLFNGLNLKFKKPKLDTCHKCDLLQSKIQVAKQEEIDALKAEQTNHHNEAQRAYDSKKVDKEKSLNDASLKVFCFDLQQCLPTPMLRTSLSFYKRPLWTFNLTVHDFVSNQAICYMWHEALAKRGGNEIASCILQHLLNMDCNTKHAIFYSDCCPGQNKNTYVGSMFEIFAQLDNNVSIIDHKFMVPGHTHMECDSDHALIEKKKKNTSVKIHHPRDWYQFIRTIGVKKKFIVEEMDQTKIYDFGSAAKTLFTWRKIDSDGQKFSWTDIKWLRYTKEFGKIYFKTTLNEEAPFKVINISKRGINSVKLDALKISYDSPIPINTNKKKDLLEMLPLVDEMYKDFYNNLRTAEMLDFHPDLTEYDENNE